MGGNFSDYRSSRLPDGDDCNFGWVIRRAPSGATMKVVVISNDLLGIRVHFYRGRTTPCLLSGCPACKAQQLSRWKGYLLVRDQSDGALVVFEFTPSIAKTLDDARKGFGTMRGLQLAIGRTNNRPNGKVTCLVKGAVPLGPDAAPDRGIWDVLVRIWGLRSGEHLTPGETDLNDLSEADRAA